MSSLAFLFHVPGSPEMYSLSLHDALPISGYRSSSPPAPRCHLHPRSARSVRGRSEEHTSELQSLTNLVCRLLLEKKKSDNMSRTTLVSSYGKSSRMAFQQKMQTENAVRLS